MITYIKMKFKEWKLKYTFYTMIEVILEENEGIVNLATNLYLTLKDVPLEELQDQFTYALANLIHKENNKE